MKKKIKLEEVPHEVQMAMIILYSKNPVGIETYEMVIDIVERYPQFFKWEHKFNSIPQEIHDAFLNECYPERFEATKHIESKNDGKGILEQIMENPPTQIKFTRESFEENYKKWQEELIEEEKRKVIEEKRIKKIWDKHYQKFGLEFRSI